MVFVGIEFTDDDDITVYTVTNGVLSDTTFTQEEGLVEIRRLHESSTVDFVVSDVRWFIIEFHLTPFNHESYYKALMRSLTATEADVIKEFGLVLEDVEGIQRTMMVLQQLQGCLKNRHYGYMGYNKLCNLLWIAGTKLQSRCNQLQQIVKDKLEECRSQKRRR
jgi:hypothetical protein